MKRLCLSLAVVSALLSSLVAQATPTVYGRAFLTLDADQTNVSTTPSNNASSSTVVTRNVALNSNGSRVGFKGSQALSPSLDFVYQLEYGVKINTNDTQFTARDSFIGLNSGQLGQLKVGRLSSVDVDYATVAKGRVLGGAGTLASYDGDRFNNAFAYQSPSFNDLQVLAFYAKEDVNNRKNFVLAVQYEPENQPYHVGLSYANSDRALRVSGDYSIGSDLTLGGLYQNSAFDSTNEHTMALSAAYDTGTPFSPYAQADYVANQGGNTTNSSKRLVLGTTYKFNANTTGHLYGAAKSDVTAESKVAAGASSSVVASVKTSSAFGVGGGLQYNF